MHVYFILRVIIQYYVNYFFAQMILGLSGWLLCDIDMTVFFQVVFSSWVYGALCFALYHLFLRYLS